MRTLAAPVLGLALFSGGLWVSAEWLAYQKYGNINDKCLQRTIFFDCLAIAQKGALDPKASEWGKVVEECKWSAYHQSKRDREYIKPECR